MTNVSKADTLRSKKIKRAALKPNLHKPRWLDLLGVITSSGIHALPEEARGLRDTFRQARDDMQEVRRIVAKDIDLGHPERVRKWDVAKYYLWRIGSTSGWQLTDDIYTLPVFIILLDRYGVATAYLAISAFSTGASILTGIGEQQAQKWKAKAQGLSIKQYDDQLTDHILDASVNAAAFNVLTTASQRRVKGDPVHIHTKIGIAKMSLAYGSVNTGFYALATQIPGLNSWTAFIVTLGAMYWIKGTIRGVRERTKMKIYYVSKPMYKNASGVGS